MSGEESVDFHFQRIHSKAQNGVIQPILTDLYQITMAYAYWKSGKMNDQAVFDLYFRKNPFNGEFTIFAGLEECIKFLKNFHFTDSDVKYIMSVLPPNTEPEFFHYLENLTANDVTLHAVDEGTVVFPKEPLMWIEGPLPAIQLMETPLLNLVNYASLVATNAMRFRLAAGPDKTLLEFGLRRAQGPDGALSASRYCYLGGFDGTSNVLAGKLYGIPVRGTHAHAFVTSYTSLSEVKTRMLKKKDESVEVDFVSLCLKYQAELSSVLCFLPDQVNEGELAAFVSYAQAFPDGFLALIDTYDAINLLEVISRTNNIDPDLPAHCDRSESTLFVVHSTDKSGLPNFCTVAMALWEAGYNPQGIRLDSGDLSYLSHMVREGFSKIANKYDLVWFANLTIVASNDINEDTIHSLNQQGHEINSFGIGTHLVTCQKQPALGGVFKLTEVNCKPRMKLSEDVEKVTIPGKKNVYRLYGTDGNALVDLMTLPSEPAPKVGQRVLCRHPFQESKRAYVIPAKVEDIHKLYWANGEVKQPLPPLTELRAKTMNLLKSVRQDHKRALNPTPYKVSVSTGLYSFMHELWLEHAPIGELS